MSARSVLRNGWTDEEELRPNAIGSAGAQPNFGSTQAAVALARSALSQGETSRSGARRQFAAANSRPLPCFRGYPDGSSSVMRQRAHSVSRAFRSVAEVLGS